MPNQQPFNTESPQQSAKLQRRQQRAGRPAVMKDAATGDSSARQGKDLLLVDLNNFATFPTLAVGILVASLRNSGH